MNDLSKTCNLPLGVRDAMHVPFVIAKVFEPKREKGDPWVDLSVEPNTWVKFTDNSFTHFVKCTKEEAHGLINPFLTDAVRSYENVVVLLVPGITTPVRHGFDIDPQLLAARNQELETRLQIEKEEDPNCADCWAIRNNEIIRY
jgi:hypothetical protein